MTICLFGIQSVANLISGAVAEWLTRERCIVSHPGSIPGRASNKLQVQTRRGLSFGMHHPLPKPEHEATECQSAMQAWMLFATLGGPIMFAVSASAAKSGTKQMFP